MLFKSRRNWKHQLNNNTKAKLQVQFYELYSIKVFFFFRLKLSILIASQLYTKLKNGIKIDADRCNLHACPTTVASSFTFSLFFYSLSKVNIFSLSFTLFFAKVNRFSLFYFILCQSKQILSLFLSLLFMLYSEVWLNQTSIAGIAPKISIERLTLMQS